ncbi:MAG TPA: glycosyltransferase family 4 protein [Planctomycetota bacterium]|nr:glycosyltransferase family 4 protein [Planctomycetota bacterium]
MNQRPRRIAFVGSSLPRKCGIATYTADLCDALEAASTKTEFTQVAVTDTEPGYSYGPRVRFEIPEKEVAAYRRAADFLNLNDVEVVSLQHEFGLFGGPAGSHVLALMRDLRMPVVATLHTVLKAPDAAQRKVMLELSALSARLVVMSRRGEQYLHEVYGVPSEKIDFIPHGIPDVPFVDPNFYKDKFKVEGRMVMLTFGLLSASKGIASVVEALPAILARNPNVVYLVVGATHPHVLRSEGETYRLALERLAQERGVEGSVVFHNRFVSHQELVEFLGAADIYITPYINEAQITSGTLAYAVGTGKATISTPYWHAQELLADGCGVLVPFNDPAAIAEKVTELLSNEPARHAMRKRAFLRGREMVWPKVAGAYARSFEQARPRRQHLAGPAGVFTTMNKRPRELPPMKLDHLRRLSDDTGIIQHAVFAVPDFSMGYTTDDNARALILAVLLEEVGGAVSVQARVLASRYMAFLWYAFDPVSCRFRNLLSYDRKWNDGELSDDSHARALWAMGTVLGRSRNAGLRGPAANLFERALRSALGATSPRAWAFSLLAIHEYLRSFTGDRTAQQARETLADRLMDIYRRASAPDWPWFEEGLSYSNAKLPHALLLCGRWMNGRPEMTEAGLKTLDWLVRMQRPENRQFVPVGSNGFCRRGGPRARFDQQPVEAYATVSACLEAHRLTGDGRWRNEAQVAFDWFLGRNDLRQPLYDPDTGGCRDGLHPDRVNQNQGAESTLAFLLSLVEMRLAEDIIQKTEMP